MEIRCPACKKGNTNETCLRCGTDLAALFAVRAAALHHLAQGRHWLTQGRGKAALASAESSWRMENTSQAAGLAFLACLLLEDFDLATTWYARGADL